MKKYIQFFRKIRDVKYTYLIILLIFSSSLVFGQTITPTKTVVQNVNSCGIIDVELKVIGANPIARPLEVVLVIDRSGSMTSGSPDTSMDHAKDAAIDFINNIFLPANNPTGLNKVAIVSYATTATINQVLTASSGQAGLISVVNSLNANGSTNIQDGIVKADNELTAHGTFNCNTSRSIILLTDGVANRTGAGGSSCSGGTGGTCIQSAITAATNAKTTTVSSVVYNNQIFSVGLFGGISGTDQTNATYCLNNIQSAGAFFTESAANLTGIYTQILNQISWVAAQIPGTAFNKETVNNNFNIVAGSISVSKGTFIQLGQIIDWNIDFLNAETITLKYQLTPKPNVCGDNIVSTSKLDYLNSSCLATFQNVTTPNYCVPCAPILSALPSPTTINCPATPNFTTPTVTNGCLSTSLTFSDITTPSSTCPLKYSITRTWTASNSCYSTTASQTINVQDVTAPVIAPLPAISTINCPAVPNFATATATDACGGTVTLTFADVTTPGTCLGNFSVTRTWTAKDNCNNTATASQTINVQDVTAPVIAPLPAISTINCPAVPNFATATATDACGGTVTLTFADVTTPGTCLGNFSVTRTWTAKDNCNNTATASQTINVQDVTIPNITTQAASQTVECDGAGNLTQLNAWLASNGGAAASDVCSGVTWTNNYSGSLSDLCGLTGAATVTFTATDACGNFSSSTGTFTIQDTTNPSLTTQASSQTVECDGAGNLTQLNAWLTSNGGASASDVCSGVTWTNNYSGSLSDLCGLTGAATVTFTATDACGNFSSSTGTFTIQDTTSPSLSTQAASQTVECDGAENLTQLNAWLASNGGASASDVCSGVTWTNNYSGSLSDLCGLTGSATVTFTATDACGNFSSSTGTFTIQDTTSPSLTTQAASQTVECDGAGNLTQLNAWLASNGGASASDICSGVTWTNNYSGSLSDLCGATGSATVTFTATDACGNFSSSTGTFTIQDTTSPSLSTQAASQTVECDGAGNLTQLNAWLASNGGASASDVCSGVTWTNNYSGSLSDLCGLTGSATVTFTATDACGNFSSSTGTFTIQDTTSPSLTTQAASQTVECDGAGNLTQLNAWLASNGGASASDVCSGVTWTNNYSGSLSDLCGLTGSATVTFTATDACGNFSSSTGTFTIQDTTSPSLTTQAASQTVECDGAGNLTQLNAWLASNGGASASDVCSGVTWTNNYSGSLSDLCGLTGSATVTFTATDACGNFSSSTGTFTIQDTTSPSLTTQAASQTVECDGAGNLTQLNAWLASNGGASASDVCSGVTWTNNFSESLSDDCGLTGSATVTFTATDACGNFSTSTGTFTIQDTTNPTISTQAADSTVECDGAGNLTQLNAWLASNGGASASDVCSGVTWTNNYSGSLSDLCGLTGSATVTFTATDACGNFSTSTGTFTIQDTTNPTISTQAADSTVECDGAGNLTQLNAWLTSNGGASASDVCSGVTWTNNYSGSLSDLCGLTGAATVTFTATDACGNFSTSTGTFTIQDTTSPSLTTQAASQTVECDGAGNLTQLNAWLASNGGASASDVCSGVTWTNNFSESLSDDCGLTGSATVTFTATDACGNFSSSTGTFTIQDTTNPSLTTQAASQTVECDGAGNLTQLNAWLASNGGASASDICSGVTWTNNYSGSLSDLCGATGAATVTFTATDACGNFSTSTGTFTIQDTTNPSLTTQAASQTVECDGAGNLTQLNAWLASNGGASASDVCSGVTWTNNFSESLSDDCGLTGSATVTFTATDACGNFSTSTGTFTIQDTTNPSLTTQAASQTVECDGSGNLTQLNAWLASNGGASASDVCSGVTWTNNYSGSLSDLCGLTGAATVTFTATDACGNFSSSTGTFTIQDTTNPSLTTQAASQTVECDGSGNLTQLNAWLASNGGASASDICSGVTWTNNYSGSLSDLCGLTGAATVTFTATDACGNFSSSTGTFTIQDTTSPSLSTQAASQTVECDGAGNLTQLNAWLASNGGAAASDVCSGVTWTNNYSGSLSDLCGATGSATVTFTATDACGNFSSSTGTFTIQDTTSPSLTTQASSQTVECDGAGNLTQLNAWLASNGGASASDVCSGVTWTNNYSGSLSDLCGLTGAATVTFTATDACGNFSSSTGTFTIQDTTNPSLTTQAASQTVECDGAGNLTQLNAWLASNGGASASDVCSGVTWTNNFSESLSDDCGLTGSATVTFTATDACGNFSTSTGTFTIQDTTNPSLTTQAASQTVECDGAGNLTQLNAWLASNGGASASDVCSGVTWTNNYSGSLSDLCGATGSATVTFTATDACGNFSSSTGTFTIQDTTNPSLTTQAASQTVECDGAENLTQLNAWLASNGGASASDVCSGVTWTNNFSESLSDDCGLTGSATVTFTATDACGNFSSSTGTFTIQDTTNPSLTTQTASQTVECDGAGNLTQLNAWLASNGGASASDICSGVTWTNNYSGSLSDLCGATGAATVTFTATDACGNSSSSTGTFTIQDTTDPSLTTQAASQTVECDGAGNLTQLNAWLASNGGASASDVCSGVTWTNNFSESLSDDCGLTGSATVTFTATDACGNFSTSTGTFTIQDTTNPSLTTQAASQTVECDGSGNLTQLNAWLASNGGASASDVCSGVTWTNNYSGSLSDLCGLTGAATVTFTATDACGNFSSSTGTFTIQDTTNPSLTTQAASQTVECDGSGNLTQLNAWLASNGGASASDICSGVTWTNNYSGSLSDLCGLTGAATVTFTATDACGNFSSSTGTFTIQDTTNPSLTTQAASQTVECDGAGNLTQLNAWLASNGGASASDVCSGVTWTNNYSGSLSDLCGLTGAATVTFTATDACGNFSTSTGTFTIQDTTNPSLTTQAASQTVECDGAGNLTQLNAWLASNGGASASDVCSGVTWTNNYSGSLSDLCGLTGAATVTFTATDACGNFSSSTGTFTIQDTTSPSLSTQAASQTVECDGAGNLTQLNAWLASNGGASASDVCSGVTWTNNYSGSLSDLCGLTGSATVTFTATDACGNFSSSTGTFTIQDTTNPSLTTQASSQTVECDGAGNLTQLNAWLASNGGASASDVCSGVTWTNNYSGSLSDLCGLTGAATVTFTATDACGNFSSSTGTFTIQDTTSPILTTQAASQTVECDGSGNLTQLNAWLASNGGASASDVCSGVTWTNNFSQSLSDDCGLTGSATVTFTATDSCGNSSSSTGTFTIQDTTDPIFTSELPQNISVSCDAIPLPQELTGSDSCSSQITVTTNDDIVENEGACIGQFTILRTWTITDSCGNDLSYTQTISVYDNTAPTLVTTLSTEIDAVCSEIPPKPNLEFVDNCSGIDPNIIYTETTTTISIYEYIIVRDWIVSDNCGNEASFSQTINVSVNEPFDAIPYETCTDKTVDLFTLLDSNLPTNGTWVEVNSVGALSGSIFTPSNLALGYYTIRYVVNVENNPCPFIYEIYIHVKDCGVVLAACDIVVFNAVSPNGDGLNEIFTIGGITCYPNNTVEIYNRWGVSVYKANGYNNGSVSFDGQSQNKLTVGDDKLPGDTYFYILKYIDTENNSIEKTGYLYVKY